MKDIDETRTYLIEWINQNKLMSKKYEKVLNYVKHLLISISGVNGCVSISPVVSLVGIPGQQLRKKRRSMIICYC